jgi:hypothetical protein
MYSARGVGRKCPVAIYKIQANILLILIIKQTV